MHRVWGELLRGPSVAPVGQRKFNAKATANAPVGARVEELRIRTRTQHNFYKQKWVSNMSNALPASFPSHSQKFFPKLFGTVVTSNLEVPNCIAIPAQKKNDVVRRWRCSLRCCSLAVTAVQKMKRDCQFP